MSAPDLSTEVLGAGVYPSTRFGKRERKLLETVKNYVDSVSPGTASHRVFAAGTFTTVGGDATESITVTGALASDIAFVVVKTAGSTPRSIVAAAAGSGSITVTLSDDPSTDHVLAYQVLRAAE